MVIMKSLRMLLLSAACLLPPVFGRAQYIASLNGIGTNTTIFGTFSALNLSWDNEPAIQIGEWPGTSAHFLIGGTNNSFGSDNGNNDLGQGMVGGNYNGITDTPAGHQIGNYIFAGMSNLIDAPYNGGSGGWATNSMIVSGFANYLKVGSGGHDDAIAFSAHSSVNDNAGNNYLLNVVGSSASAIYAGNSGQSSNDLVLNGVNSAITNSALSIAIGKNAVVKNYNSVFLYSDGSLSFTNGTALPVSPVTNNETIFYQENGFCINTNFAGPYALNVNGSINASSYSGDGSGLTDLSAANLSGVISSGQLPGNVVTTNDASVILTDLSLNGPLEMASPIITSGGNPVFDSDANGNVFVGNQSGFDDRGSSNNTAVGYASLYSNTIGFANTVEGFGALANTPNALDVIAIGYAAGANYTNSERDDILIGSEGVAGESGVTRIGDPSVQTATYLAGNVYASGAVFSNGVDIVSDRNAKENFEPVDAQSILKKVASLPLSEWNYRTSKDIEHIGPMAQDFHATFGLNGNDNKHISVVDEGGVALAAIQGLNQELRDKDAEIHELQQSLAELNARVAALAQAKASPRE